MEPRKSLFVCLVSLLVFGFMCIAGAFAQSSGGTITGRVSDPRQGVLPGARIDVQPVGNTVMSNNNCEFHITTSGLADTPSLSLIRDSPSIPQT
jgi:hypothetical protein